MRLTNHKLKSLYEQATPEEIDNGLTWYNDARSYCEAVSNDTGTPINMVAKVVSCLSPSVNWDRNKIDALTMIKAHKEGLSVNDFKVSTYGQNKLKAWDILEGKRDLESKSRKTYAFYRNIADLSADYVTIDRHAIRAILSHRRWKGLTGSNGGITISKGLYEASAVVYDRFAKKIGIKGYELQAIVWLVYKRTRGV